MTRLGIVSREGIAKLCRWYGLLSEIAEVADDDDVEDDTITSHLWIQEACENAKPLRDEIPNGWDENAFEGCCELGQPVNYEGLPDLFDSSVHNTIKSHQGSPEGLSRKLLWRPLQRIQTYAHVLIDASQNAYGEDTFYALRAISEQRSFLMDAFEHATGTSIVGPWGNYGDDRINENQDATPRTIDGDGLYRLFGIETKTTASWKSRGLITPIVAGGPGQPHVYELLSVLVAIHDAATSPRRKIRLEGAVIATIAEEIKRHRNTIETLSE